MKMPEGLFNIGSSGVAGRIIALISSAVIVFVLQRRVWISSRVTANAFLARKHQCISSPPMVNLRIPIQHTIFLGNDFAMHDIEFGTVQEPSSLLALAGLSMIFGVRTWRKRG